MDLTVGELLPARWLAWGHVHVGERYEGRYLVVKLPSYSWEYFIYHDEFAWGQRCLIKLTGRPWRCLFLFD